MSFEELARLANRVNTLGLIYGIILGCGAIGGGIYFFTQSMTAIAFGVMIGGLFEAVLIGATIRCIGITLFAVIRNRQEILKISDKLGIDPDDDDVEEESDDEE